MKRALGVAGLVLLTSFLLTVKAEAQSAPNVLSFHTFSIGDGLLPAPTAPFDMFHLLLDIPAGGSTGSHSHPFGCVSTVVEGQVTNRLGSSGFVAAGGQRLVFPANQFGRHANDSIASRALFFASGFTPVGAPIAAAESGAAAPAVPAPVLFSARTTVDSAPARMELAQLVVEFPPGAVSPAQRSNGPGLVSVIEGEVTIRVAGADTRVRARETFTDRAGQVHEARNTGSTTAKLIATYLVAPGQPPIAPVQGATQVTPPSTGDAGLAEDSAGQLSPVLLIVTLGALVLLASRAFSVKPARGETAD